MLLRTSAAAVVAAVLSLGASAPALATDGSRGNGNGHGNPENSVNYSLTGDPEGSRFEGIGADQRRGVFYVSETTGGEIHRGVSGLRETEEWLAAGVDGRTTARGIKVDDAGRVYIAGGPNGLGTGRPDVWVYDADGTLLTALRVPSNDAFLNDVVIGPDGAAYFTDSNDARIYRVAEGAGGWEATVWADATRLITRQQGFNLGGIEVSADKSAFIVAQGNVGRLWRFGMDGSVREIPVDADLVNADGLVLQGNRLTVVRNFSRVITTLRMADDGSAATTLEQTPSAANRVLTTAALLRGEMLYVDSKFGPNTPVPPYEVVTNPFR